MTFLLLKCDFLAFLAPSNISFLSLHNSYHILVGNFHFIIIDQRKKHILTGLNVAFLQLNNFFVILQTFLKIGN